MLDAVIDYLPSPVDVPAINGILDDGSIVMVEQWESIAHLEAHLQTPHMKAYSEAVKGDVLDMNIRILESGI